MRHRNEWFKKVCKYIGCSGTSQKCPGNPECSILRKLKYINTEDFSLLAEDGR